MGNEKAKKKKTSSAKEDSQMTKQDIIMELFDKSPAMATRLAAAGNCSDTDLLNAICGAPISLNRKSELPKKCSEWDSWRHNRECEKRIEAIEQALAQLVAKPGEVFLWRSCWYDCGVQNNIGCSEFEPCLSMTDVYSAIDDGAEFEEDLTEETAEGSFFNEGWVEIRKWERQIGKDGQPHLVKTPWEYVAVHRELCFFTRRLSLEEVHDPVMVRLGEVCNGSSNLNLSIPFKSGDIITVDCGAFAPIHHAVLLSVSTDCCGVQIAYVDENKKLQTSALKHSHCFTDNYCSVLSPLYRIALYEGALDEDEKELNSIRNNVLGGNSSGLFSLY